MYDSCHLHMSFDMQMDWCTLHMIAGTMGLKDSTFPQSQTLFCNVFTSDHNNRISYWMVYHRHIAS